MEISKILKNWVPLVSSFIDSSALNRKNAAKEVALILVLSLVPIWGGAIHSVATLPNDSDFLSSLHKLIMNGELLLYSTSILAPIFYLVFSEPDGEKQYPDRYVQGLIIMILLIISLILFSAQRTNPDIDYIFNWSIVIFFVSIIFLYIATVFRNWVKDSTDFKNEERSFSADYRDRRLRK